MNKLGFYTKNFAAPGVIEAIREVQPPVLLTELDDFSILEKIRHEWSPNTFVVGRFHFPHDVQGAMVNSADPEAEGRKLAEKVLTHNFGFAKNRDDNDRPYIDAWMSLNESIRGPNSFRPQAMWNDEDRNNFARMEQQAANYDTLQAAFLQELRQEGLQAVAFNFAAGNWVRGEDYVKYFPRTLEAYTYLGFHEYGWPHMNPREPGARSGCGFYRPAMDVIRRKYGTRHQVIITEAGLARMYMHQDEGGDVGWLYQADSVAEDSYKSSLRWYNQMMVQDPYVLGACLFQVGPGHDWETFRHTGLDNQGRPLSLMQELAAMAREPAPVFAAAAVAKSTTKAEAKTLDKKELIETLRAAGEHLVMPLNRKSLLYKTGQENDLGDRLTGEYEVMVADQNYTVQRFEGGLVYAPTGQWDQLEAVRLPAKRSLTIPPLNWTQDMTGFHGNRWQYWEQTLQGKIPGLTWHVFAEEALKHNPHLADDNYIFRPGKTYKMPQVPGQPEVSMKAHTAAPVPLLSSLSAEVSAPPPDFVQVIGDKFYIKGKPARFIGANIRGLIHYGHDPQDLPHTFPEHQTKQLQEAAIMNARLVRVFLAHKNATPAQVESRLRHVLSMIKQNFPDIYLLPAFTNLYSDVPFYVQGEGNFYTPNLNLDFFREGYRDKYLSFVKHIVNIFKDEANIFGWEIGNELKAEHDSTNGAPEELVNFMLDMAKEIKTLDPHHLVTTGMISTRHAWMAHRQDLREKLYSSPNIDFITIHAYDGNEKKEEEKEDDSDLATHFQKPFIIEEAGFNIEKYGNRPEKTREDMANWFGRGASSYMPWGFMATDRDNGDGDNVVGMGKQLGDWKELFELHRLCGDKLLNYPDIDDIQGLANQIRSINYSGRRAMMAELPWPFLTDGFDFPV
ncbi:MAG: hypothetical protein PVH87_27700, partial [Desulfobacteraceae bacterium]